MSEVLNHSSDKGIYNSLNWQMLHQGLKEVKTPITTSLVMVSAGTEIGLPGSKHSLEPLG